MSYRPQWNGRSGYSGKRKHTWLKVLLASLALGVLLFAALEIYIGVHSRTRIQGEPRVMVIFGCQVRRDGPSILLRDRLDTALDYLEDHPDMTVVVAGAQGTNEPTTEAAAMADYLRAHDFKGTILLEEKSYNTWQNVNCSLELLAKEGYDITDEVILVSNSAHLARAEMLWGRATGTTANVSALAAPMSHRPSAIQMFFREPLALVKSFFFDR